MPEPLLDEKTRAEITEVLSHMAEPVKLLLFVEQDPCVACQAQQSLLEAVATLSNKLVLLGVEDEHSFHTR